jgi:hypothetical protein
MLPFAGQSPKLLTSLQVCQAERDVGEVWLVSYGIPQAARAHARVPEEDQQ